MNKKRLLFISNLYPNPLQPHMASFNRQQVAALSRHFEIEVIAPVPWQIGWHKGSFPRFAEEWGASHHPTYWYTPGFGRRFYGQFYLRSIRSLVLRLNRQKPFEHVFGAWLYPDGWAAAKIAEELNIPFFLKVHGTDVNRLKEGTFLTALAMKSVERARKVFCVSQALKERLVEFGCNPEKIAVVYNGIDKEIFYPQGRVEARRGLGLDEGRPLILYVGNLKGSKGLKELGVAFGKLIRKPSFDSVNMAVVGSGGFQADLEGILKQEGCADAVHFLGVLPLGKVAQCMNAADVLCLPSYSEGVPNVILESLACGVPVVATDVGGIPELAREDGRLRLVSPKNVDDLVLSLEDVLSCRDWPKKRLAIRSWQDNAAEVAAHML